MSLRDIIVICVIILLGITGLIFATDLPSSLSFIALFFMSGAIALYGRLSKPKTTQKPIPPDVSLQEQARLADGIPEAIIILNRQEKIIYANQAAKRLFVFKDDRPALSALIQNNDVRQLVQDTLAGNNPESVTYHRRSPVERHIRVMGSAIYSSQTSQKVKRAIIVFYDITDLVRVNTMRADFLANASHELKTPVASLLGYIETLRGHAKDDPEAQEMFLGIMQQQAERMQRLIDDLLSLRRIEIAEHLVPTETADLYLATRAATEAIRPLSQNENVRVKYQGPEEVLVLGIQDELVQLILNLLDNAVAITAKKDIVTVNCNIVSHISDMDIWSKDPNFADAHRREIVPLTNMDKGYAVLKVSDRGPGFPHEHLHRVGERFYKISGIKTGHKRGTGLGLAIVKHIMRRHRGGLFIETKENIGTEFTVALPLSEQHL